MSTCVMKDIFAIVMISILYEEIKSLFVQIRKKLILSIISNFCNFRGNVKLERTCMEIEMKIYLLKKLFNKFSCHSQNKYFSK